MKIRSLTLRCYLLPSLFRRPKRSDQPQRSRILLESRGSIEHAAHLEPNTDLFLEHFQIDGLIAAEITPFVTLFHWDTPLALERRYGGFSASEDEKEELMLDFDRYVGLMFETFGDRVKHWITHNEVSSIVKGYVGERLTEERSCSPKAMRS